MGWYLQHMMTSSNGNIFRVISGYWPFVRGIHQSPVNSPRKGQWRGPLMFSSICAWINGWVNNREAGDLKRHRTHYDVTVMNHPTLFCRHQAPMQCMHVSGLLSLQPGDMSGIMFHITGNSAVFQHVFQTNSKSTPKLSIWPFITGTAHRLIMRKEFPCHDVIRWWKCHEQSLFINDMPIYWSQIGGGKKQQATNN